MAVVRIQVEQAVVSPSFPQQPIRGRPGWAHADQATRHDAPGASRADMKLGPEAPQGASTPEKRQISLFPRTGAYHMLCATREQYSLTANFFLCVLKSEDPPDQTLAFIERAAPPSPQAGAPAWPTPGLLRSPLQHQSRHSGRSRSDCRSEHASVDGQRRAAGRRASRGLDGESGGRNCRLTKSQSRPTRGQQHCWVGRSGMGSNLAEWGRGARRSRTSDWPRLTRQRAGLGF